MAKTTIAPATQSRRPTARGRGRAVLVGLVVWTSLWAGACVYAGAPATGPSRYGAEFSGQVVDQRGKPIAEARVEVNRQETYSRADGFFRVAVPTDERYLLNLSHPDFADFSYLSRTPLENQTWTLVRAQVETVDPTRPILIADRRRELETNGLGGARFELEPGSLVDAAGQPPAGAVRAAIATLDVANGEGPGDWAVRSDDGRREGFLVSYGAVFVQFTDPSGQTRYQLAPGRTARLSLPVIPSMRRHTGSATRAPFWYYDTADGYWKKNGAAVFDRASGAYVGKVDHLSTINTDIAKFGDAACLKITLDPSIAPGNKLRIRYHSGGTPFGQTPTFVMNDTVNAAYRLPASTNVLVELMSPSDEVFGNLVVEDPAGSPLVNTVVDTGAPIPSGHTLWPPAPYTDCKPILLRLGMPEVEIRINELPAAAAPRDNPTDDYVTWAPTFSRARLASPMAAGVTVVLTNDASGAVPGGGDVLFAVHQDPWPINTTATANSLTLALPADGSWVPFVIAGKHGTPSTNDKDTIIEAHQGTAAGPVIGRKALMVRVRKNANDLTASERSRFLFAWRKLRNRVGTNYVLFQEMHRLASGAGDEAHMQPAFLSWHRALLLQVERELQKLEPSVALHYWDWDAAAPNVFSQDFMGAPGSGGFVEEPKFSASNPLNGWDTDLPFASGELRRNTQDHTLDPGAAMKPLDHPVDPDLVAWSDYGPTSSSIFAVNSFSDAVEKDTHNPAHGWPCGAGHLNSPNRSAADPLFYLLHSQIDREWAYWQRAHNRFGVPSGGTLTFPAPAHYENSGAFNTPGNTPDASFRQRGSYLEDGLWPWDGTSGGTPSTVEWRPLNQATSGGTNVPVSTPLIPMTSFPASPRANLWPPAATIPRNADMIDYHGRFRVQDGLGFSYDDVPY